MPNWCYNDIELTMTTAQAEAMKQKITTPAPDNANEFFVRVLPSFKQYVESSAGQPYDWNEYIERLGCKWDIPVEGETYDEMTNDAICMRFSADSPWSPPLEGLQALVDEGVVLHYYVRYFEPGLGFFGEGRSHPDMDGTPSWTRDDLATDEGRQAFVDLFDEETWQEWFEVEEEAND